MNDILENIINEAMHPTRADAMLELVKSLSTVGYQGDFDNAITIAARHDSSLDAVGEIESLIFRTAGSLLNRLGIECDMELAYNKPKHLGHIIDALLFDIEEWDDYDTLLAIVDSGEPANIALGNVTSFITCEPASNYHDLLLSVQDNTLQVIRGALAVKSIRDTQEELPVDRELVARVVNYIEKFPHSVLATKFIDYGFYRSSAELATEVEIQYDSNRPEDYPKALGVVAAGLAILDHSSYKEAYESDLAKYVRPLLDDDHIRYLLAGVREANNILQSLYPVEDHE